MRYFLICFFLCAFLLFNSSCTGNQIQDASPPNVLTISDNTQGSVGDVHIGAGNFGVSEYEAAEGKKNWGPAARLWINVNNDPSSTKTFPAGKGSKFSAGRFTFEVLEVTKDKVIIQFSPPV